MNAGNQKSAVAIGNFDGFHLGHLKIIDTLKAVSQKENLCSHLVTFTPNPRLYFKKEPYLINTDEQKRKLLEENGPGRVTFLDFTRVNTMDGEDFLRRYLVERFDMGHIVVGKNFRFGKGRGGDTEFLEAVGRRWGFGLTVVEPVLLDGVHISSTRIRRCLALGQIELANRMLNRDFFIEGIVTEGDKMGRELGFPTINVETPNLLLPEGVFKTRVEIGERVYKSITNIGYRPTFTGQKKRVESHIFDFSGSVYGEYAKIFFVTKLRDEIKFESAGNLVKQIKKDIENSRL